MRVRFAPGRQAGRGEGMALRSRRRWCQPLRFGFRTRSWRVHQESAPRTRADRAGRGCGMPGARKRSPTDWWRAGSSSIAAKARRLWTSMSLGESCGWSVTSRSSELETLRRCASCSASSCIARMTGSQTASPRPPLAPGSTIARRLGGARRCPIWRGRSRYCFPPSSSEPACKESSRSDEPDER